MMVDGGIPVPIPIRTVRKHMIAGNFLFLSHRFRNRPQIQLEINICDAPYQNINGIRVNGQDQGTHPTNVPGILNPSIPIFAIFRIRIRRHQNIGSGPHANELRNAFT